MEENNFLEKEKKRRISIWVISTIVIALLLIISIFTHGFGISGITGAATKDVGETVKTYIEENLVEPGTEVEVKNVEKENGLYKLTINIQGQEFDSYVSEDGKLLFPSVVDMSKEIPTNGNTEVKEVPKANKPKVELFVMTHCPYGTQSEKGFIPAIEKLGDKIDANIRFVHYFMHAPEEEETPRQICIREEQSSKYYDYLKCFLEGDGNADSSGYIANGNDPEICIKKVRIDETKLDKCIDKKSDDYYADDSALSKDYGVSGSPTLAINGVITSSGRDPNSYLQTICSTFTTAPKECDEKLSTVSPSPGFGYAEGEDSSAQC